MFLLAVRDPLSMWYSNLSLLALMEPFPRALVFNNGCSCLPNAGLLRNRGRLIPS